MEDYSYKEVRRWTVKAKIDIFELDYVIFPMNIGETHWAMGAIDLKDKGFRYFDSMFSGLAGIRDWNERSGIWLKDSNRKETGRICAFFCTMVEGESSACLWERLWDKGEGIVILETQNHQ